MKMWKLLALTKNKHTLTQLDASYWYWEMSIKWKEEFPLNEMEIEAQRVYDKCNFV